MKKNWLLAVGLVSVLAHWQSEIAHPHKKIFEFKMGFTCCEKGGN